MATSQKVKKPTPEDAILIIGDWVVDEYWFLVRHHSAISSHVGFEHFRVSCNKGERYIDLCGAGHVARAFYDLTDEDEASEQMIGIGKWNKSDEALIGHLIHARSNEDCMAARAGFCLTTGFCKNPVPIKLINLDSEHPTTRIIRCYHEEHGGLRQLHRIDWEPSSPGRKSTDVTIDLDNANFPHEEITKAIVVNDLARDVVDENLIRALRDKYLGAKWFVRSKDKAPSWISLIEDKLVLYMVGPEVASQFSPANKWLVSGKISARALDIINNLPGENVVLVSNNREVLGKVNKGASALTAKSTVEPSVFSWLGWPTAFFASVVKRMLRQHGRLNEKSIARAIKWSDDNAGVPSPPRFKRVSHTIDSNPCPPFGDWNSEVRQWEQSQSGQGIVEVEENEQKRDVLQVWRGSSLVSGYVTCIEEKNAILNDIARNIVRFKQSQRKTPLSILLQADPGAGKTYLAKCLSIEYDFEFAHFDLTQMMCRDEILDLFESVSTLQAESKKDVLVFVDEINAYLEGTHAYAAFLSPLEEGNYLRRGRRFSLRPCVWMFAGTKFEDEQLKRAEKLSDLKSRISLVKNIDYKSLRRESGRGERFYAQARLEQVYLGAMMLRKEYSDVSEVGLEVLNYFYSLDPSESPARRIRKLVQSLESVQYGRITGDRNCQNWDEIEGGWPLDRNDRRLIQLEFD